MTRFAQRLGALWKREGAPGWQEASYESTYHQTRHALLIKSALYYDLKAREAKEVFFKGIDPQAEVFEFGVGLGKNIALLERKAGYDISAFARSFAEARGIRVFDDMADVPDERFDVVLSSHVLEHLNDPFENLKLLRTKLKPGGCLILVLPVERHEHVPFDVDINQHLFSWNFRAINNLLQRAGYQIKENRFCYGAAHYKLRYLGGLSFRLYRAQTELLGWLFNHRDMMVVARKREQRE